MAAAVDQGGLDGWTVEKKKVHYTLAYWVSYVLGMLSQSEPLTPDVTYTLRNDGTDERCKVTLPSDHKPADMAAAIARNVARA